VQPDRRLPGGVLIDAKSRWLAVGNETDAIEAGEPHALDDLIG
jgi:hypothetical protein